MARHGWPGAIAAALGVLVAAGPAAAEGAGGGVAARTGSQQGRDTATRPDRPHRPDRPGWGHRHRPLIIYDRDDHYPGARLPPRPRGRPEPEEETETEAQTEERAPPPVRSPRSRVVARGVEPDGKPFEIGEPLPADRPHVTLDWRTYELPEPPPGTIYARVGSAVLRIEADSRVVLERLDPETLRQ